MPVSDAGQVIDPSVSVPIAADTIPAATATALPDDDPHADRSSAYGLRVSPPAALHPLTEREPRMLAHSLRLALPRITAPAARSRATSGASRPVTLSASASDPAVVATGSAVSMLSFTSTGTPCSAPRGPRAARSASSARASSAALGFSASTACSAGPARSRAATRSRAADVAASADRLPSRSASASAAVPRSAGPGGAPCAAVTSRPSSRRSRAWVINRALLCRRRLPRRSPRLARKEGQGLCPWTPPRAGPLEPTP